MRKSWQCCNYSHKLPDSRAAYSVGSTDLKVPMQFSGVPSGVLQTDSDQRWDKMMRFETAWPQLLVHQLRSSDYLHLHHPPPSILSLIGCELTPKTYEGKKVPLKSAPPLQSPGSTPKSKFCPKTKVPLPHFRLQNPPKVPLRDGYFYRGRGTFLPVCFGCQVL
jgi:hypothetical protein